VPTTLLIDLDDTLLLNPMETFIPAYLDLLSEHLSNFVEPGKTVEQLLRATTQMSQNKRPDCTLKEIFDSHFYPSLQINQEDVREALDEFYREIFPGLKRLTRPRPGAGEFLAEAITRRYSLAIATNPLFPETAIQQRIRWAELPYDGFPFTIVPSYETFHFAKPDPAYIAELMAKIGWPEGSVVMVGNDATLDISPAIGLGVNAFWAPVDEDELGIDIAAGTGKDDISKFFDWFDSNGIETRQPNYNTPEALLAILRSTPAALDSFYRDLGDESLTRRPRPDEWSQTEILCHLRDVEEEVNLERVDRVLAEHNPFIIGQDTDPWAQQRNYICQNGLDALEAFTNLRNKLVKQLEQLLPMDWDRPARHTILGPTNLKELIRIITAHDRLHIKQSLEVRRMNSKINLF
jgi:FMN phosphatase YigB (HAD superfamily)